MSNSFLYDFYFIISGIGVTFQLLTGGFILGLIGGICLTILRHNNYGASFITFFISVIRGIPLLLQLSFFYFVVPRLLDIRLNLITAGIIALGLNSSAYIAEILKSGINSISKGQFEAAKVLGIPSFYLWKDILIPQVIRTVLPSLINEIIALLKETALISTIGGVDIMKKAQMISIERYTYFMPLVIAGLCYYLCVIIIEWCGKILEKRSNYDNH